MYESHWGLQESPFRRWASSRDYFPSPTHEEALARLHFLVDNRRRLGLLLGPSGSGKSLVLDVFARDLRAAAAAVASVSLVGLGAPEFLWELATQTGRSPRPSDTEFQLWRTIGDRLAENHYRQLTTVFLLDDADAADRTVLNYVARLLLLDQSTDCPLTVVISSSPERSKRIGARILQLCDLRIDLEPWDREETGKFLQSSLAKAGGERKVFADDAEARLHELADGIPRAVSSLAELALLAGAGNQLPMVDVMTVESVYHELVAGR